MEGGDGVGRSVVLRSNPEEPIVGSSHGCEIIQFCGDLEEI